MTKPLNISILDHQGNIIAVNNAWQSFAAENSDDPNIFKKAGIGANYLEVCRLAEGNCSAEAEAVHQGIADVLEGKVNFFSLEYPCHSPSEERWFSLNCTPLLSSEMRAVVSHSDITDKKILNKHLVDSEENYHHLFADNPFPMFVFDLETLHFLEVNQAAVDHYGYSRQEFLEMTIKDIRPGKDISKLLRTISRLDDHISSVGIWDHLKKDGTLIKVEINTHSLNFEGRSARLVIINDVTERLQSEEKLKSSEERYRLMFENNPSPMIIYDYETLKFLDVNEATCQHYGYTHDEILTMKLTDFGSPLDIKNIRGLVEKNNGGRTIYGVWKHKKKDGTEIIVETASHKLEIEGENSRIVLINDVTEKIKAEEHLQFEKERFERLATASPGVIFSFRVSPEGNVSLPYANPITKEIYGYEPEELKDDFTPVFARVEEEENKLLQAAIFESAKNMSVFHRVIGYDHPQKGKVWLEVSSAPTLETDGSIVWHGITTDVTERIKAQEEKREAEERFRATFEQAAVGISHVALDGKLLHVNNKLCEITGYTKAELTALKFQDITFPDDLEKDLKQVKKVLAGEIETFSMEKRYIRKDKALIWVNLTVSLVRDSEGQPKYFISVIEDISHRKSIENELRQWADAFENCAHGIALSNPKTNQVIAVNDAFAKLLGKSKNEIVNQPILSVHDPQIHEKIKNAITTTDKEGSVQYEAQMKRGDGKDFTAQVDVVSVRGESGEVLYRVATMQDISARKEAEENLRQSEEKFRQSQKMEAVGRLAGGIAHDFNNMLTVIKGYSDLILRLVSKENPLHNYITEIKEAGERSTFLTNQLLAFSRTQVFAS